MLHHFATFSFIEMYTSRVRACQLLQHLRKIYIFATLKFPYLAPQTTHVYYRSNIHPGTNGTTLCMQCRQTHPFKRDTIRGFAFKPEILKVSLFLVLIKPFWWRFKMFLVAKLCCEYKDHEHATELSLKWDFFSFLFVHGVGRMRCSLVRLTVSWTLADTTINTFYY